MWFEVKNIRVHYERVEVLKGISIELDMGSMISLIGANGAGKTTILRAVSGLKRPTTGEIWFKGERIDGIPPQKITGAGIAHVPEGRKVFPQMTVYENLKMGAYLRSDSGEISQDLENIYVHFPILKKRSRQQAGSLSGGEQQMLAIARALMTKPSVMLLDEPTLGLSPLMVTEIAKIITDINLQRVGVVLVEQNAYLALSLAQKGYVLETGRIVLEGYTKDIINNEHVKKAYLGG